MRFRAPILLLAAVLAAAVAAGDDTASLRRVRVLATGGTIAGAQASATD